MTLAPAAPPTHPAWAPEAIFDYRGERIPLPAAPPQTQPITFAARDGWHLIGRHWPGPRHAAGQSLLTITAPDGTTSGILAARKTRGFATTTIEELVPGLRVLLRPDTARAEKYRAREEPVAWAALPVLHEVLRVVGDPDGSHPCDDEWPAEAVLGWASTGLTDLAAIEQRWTNNEALFVRESSWWPWFAAGFTEAAAIQWHEAFLDDHPDSLGWWHWAMPDLHTVREWRRHLPGIRAEGAADAYTAGWTINDVKGCLTVLREHLARQAVPQYKLENDHLGWQLIGWPQIVPDPVRFTAYFTAGIDQHEAALMEAQPEPPALNSLRMLAAFNTPG